MAQSKGPRHVPQRTCVACRSVSPKRGAVRIVRTAEGRVEVDETGKRPGRGAYLCQRKSCWEAALTGRKDPLGHSLKVALQPADREALRSYALRLPGSDEEG
ncbi:MAG: DUF448 domain-containing protein [Dehalococcoidia bacterium]|nr:DUF448 domain-containing protein [Dehalococcoidia bacterium]